ncbi:hypothetical protein AMTRI_Chr06g201550 [Amborella trichopoda]|uniref:Tubby C-terminal domain-containing protein n=1 Tax=Amborella trichopoda TaxID=13333 RepID=U5DFA7_AMBTC|nr:protein LURP-one-related 5 [Amborella trichopoda]ERN20132.1 hypothetical protein AMTR_s00066p00069810 [Amborella trichopoda]|eukprot:XP_006858665.1 protein LURP-one-related 5 [Amborella trichopoda]
MSRVYPEADKCNLSAGQGMGPPAMLTVWKKSSMALHGTDGFTVFDCHGNMAFRVDNYTRSSQGLTSGLVLMDGAGTALLTLRPKILSTHDRWEGFEGEAGPKKTQKHPVFALRRCSVFQNNDQAEVFMGSQVPKFQIEGCFRKRNCTIKTATGELVAKISRKMSRSNVMLTDDVFSMVVHPGHDHALLMAFVVVLDRISRKPYTPVLCY